MVKRTKKDVRYFCRSTTVKKDEGKYGRAIFSGSISDNRFNRFVDHGWVNNDGTLNKKGKCMLLRWKNLPGARKTLKDEGAPKFISRSKSNFDPKSDLDSQNYRGLRVLEDSHDDIPTGHEKYYPREIRGGKTDLDLVARALAYKNHVLLKGETGTGKTEIAHHLGQMTNRPTYQVNFSNETRISHLLGHYEVYEEQGATEMKWVDGVLTKAVKNGGIFVADEINAADGATTMLLHSVTEKGDATMTIPEKGETIDVHDDFRLIGTMNPRYAGTRQQNKAFETRFFHLNIDYLPKSTELKILADNTNITSDIEDKVDDIVTLARNLRDDYKRGDLSVPITIREMIRAVEFLEDGFMDTEETAKTIFLEKFPKEDKAPVEKTIETCL